MKFCPLIKSKCLKEECSLWVNRNHIEGCALRLIPGQLDDLDDLLTNIVDDLREIKRKS